MVRKGYIERQLEGLAQVLARLAGLPDLGEAAMRRRLSEACRELTGLDLGTLSTLSDATLLGCFASGDRTRRAANAAVAARLLEERARIEPTGGPALRRKALLLAAEAIALEPVLREGEFRTGFERLRRWVETTGNTPMVRAALAGADEALGRHAAAESAWIGLEDDGDATAKANRIAFYVRLLELPDDELANGGLPREEILEMLRDCEGTSG
ncbi:MAG: DUF6483 family protein [Armatimonadota bacterium]